MVLLSAPGDTVEPVAEIFGGGEDVVRKWLHRYERAGPLGLDDRPRPGRPPKDRLARRIVAARASTPPCNNGLVQGTWTGGRLAAFVATRFRLVLSPASVRRYLHQAGWRGARPRLAPATHAPRGQRKEDPAAPWPVALLAQAVASAATLLYLDECDLPPRPVIRARWMKGPRLRVPTPGQNVKRTLFGALAAAYPVGEISLVLDNVITHDAKLVRAWLARPEQARFRFLWLPKDSAHERNPIERVRGVMKDAVAANRLHGSIDRRVEEAHRFFATTTFQAPHPIPAMPDPVSNAVGQAA